MKKKHRALALLLALLMVITYIPSAAFAASEYIDTSGYSEKVTYPNAKVKYTTGDGRELSAHYEGDEPVFNFPQPGDVITMTRKGGSDVYTCNSELVFVSESGEPLNLSPYMDPNEANQIKASAYTDPVYNHTKKQSTYKYFVDFIMDVKVTSDALSIRFEPDYIVLDTKDVTDTSQGYVSYDFDMRGGLAPGYDDIYTPYKAGDKLFVTYADGERVYNYDPANDWFISDSGDPDDHLRPVTYNMYLYEGREKGVEIRCMGRSAYIKVFLDSAKTRKEREWKGTVSKSVPAAKSVKVRAGKKKLTVRWTKASAADLEKFDKVEIQVCPNSKFARKNTTRVNVSKSKKSYTVKKGLKRGKYYWVRVRNVKGKGAGKLVSKWSKARKVKVK